jgi:hypothetical protein
LNALNCLRLLGDLSGMYATQPVTHYFWKAASEALVAEKRQ